MGGHSRWDVTDGKVDILYQILPEKTVELLGDILFEDMKLMHPYGRRNLDEKGIPLESVGAGLDGNLRPYCPLPDFEQALFLRVKKDIVLFQYARKDIAQSLQIYLLASSSHNL
jgi:hypothetical protein